MLWSAWRVRQVMRDGVTRRAVGKHLARFILVGLYTGTRSQAICEAALMPTVGRGWVDLDAGVFHRRAIGRRATNKRQPSRPLRSRRSLRRGSAIRWKWSRTSFGILPRLG
jgi:hypothetical protein